MDLLEKVKAHCGTDRRKLRDNPGWTDELWDLIKDDGRGKDHDGPAEQILDINEVCGDVTYSVGYCLRGFFGVPGVDFDELEVGDNIMTTVWYVTVGYYFGWLAMHTKIK